MRVLKSTHINVLELRAHLREEKMLAATHRSLRIPFGIDSQVALGALTKGRAASKALNAELQKTLAYPLGSDLYGNYMYFLSEHNRADGPTRRRAVDDPDAELPVWWTSLSAGDPTLFDRWMRMHASEFCDDGPPFDELCSSTGIDLKPRRSKQLRPSRGLVLQARVKREKVEAEEWKYGRYETLLCDEALAVLYSFDRSQFFLPDNFEGFKMPGAIDLFSGCFGVAKEMIRYGCPWVLCFEWNRSRDEDLLDPAVRQKIEQLLRLGAVESLGAAPICASFSTAVTPPVRSARFPRGLPSLSGTMKVSVMQGNSHNDFLIVLVDICIEAKIAFFIENPDESWWWWRQRKWRRFRSSTSQHLFRLCFCRFGTPWQKATRIATNTALRGLKMWCQCHQRHTVLRGMHPIRKIPMTRVAQPYPAGLNRLLAIALCSFAGWCKKDKLNVAGCARTGSIRVGEATNPGPRSRRWVPRSGNLEDLPVQTSTTLALEARLLDEFLDWCNSSLATIQAQELFQKVPSFLALTLRCYGNFLFQYGGALSNLRHVLIAAQRWQPLVRPFMATAWEIVGDGRR